MATHNPEKLKGKLVEHAKDFPLFKLMGVELVDFGPRWSTTRIAHRQELCNPNGVIHGGVVAFLMDQGITQAMLMTDEYQREVREGGGFMTTIDLRVRYLRPLTGGTMTCEAKIPHLGRRVIHAEAVIKNDDGKEIALAESIVTLVAGKKKA